MQFDSLDLMLVRQVKGSARALTGGATAALLFDWILELAQDAQTAQKRAKTSMGTVGGMLPDAIGAFHKIYLQGTMEMTLLNQEEFDYAMALLQDKKIISVTWPEEEEDEGHCWVRLNIERIRKLTAEIHGG